jgi:hypothetical protein
MKRSLTTVILIFLFGGLALAQSIPVDSLYFGQTSPGNTPQIFAPGFISITGRIEYGISIAPSGDEMLFAIGEWPDKRTMIVKYANNHWTSPDTVSYSTTRSAEESIYSPNGQRVYYYAYDPPNPVGGSDLCYSEKSGSVWGEPINLGSPLNTMQDEYHPCVVADSSVYFENSAGTLCYSKYQNGAYQPRVILPAIFNDPDMAWGNPFVSPDESYFIFNSARPGGFGSTDLYISYKKDDGSWTNPKNLGNIINTPTYECGAEITDDNKYLTYVSNNDIYWVGSGFIDSLKYTNFAPYAKYPIPNQIAYAGHNFTFGVSDSTFFDDDGDSSLTYNAKLTNGNPLPGWLTFDSTSVIFSGIPTAVQVLNVKVTAYDSEGASGSTTMRIQVKLSTSLDEPAKENEGLRIFPNPLKGKLNILWEDVSDETTVVEIYDLSGGLLVSRKFLTSASIDFKDKPKGIYILKLSRGKDVMFRKVYKI